MHYTIISGSHRPQSQSTKIANYIKDILPTTITTDIIDLRNNPLPLRNDYMRDSSSTEYAETAPLRNPMKKILTTTDALIIIAPERSGMVPAGLKNFFLYCSSTELANKPALAIGVSSGINGAYPLSELKISSNKNTQFFYIPQHLIIRDINNILNQSDEITEREKNLHQRINYSLAMLHEYAQAMRQVRQSGVPNLVDYPYGM